MKQKSTNIWFKDRNNERKLIPLENLGFFTGRQWFDFDYSFIKAEDMTGHLKDFLNNPLEITNSLEIRFMNDKVGYGLFAVNNISKHTVLGFVSGELKKMKVACTFFKSTKATNLIQSGTIAYNDSDEVYIIDSSKKSNHTHYIQHLPSSEMLSVLNIDDDAIATSNLEQHSLNYGYDFTYFMASRNILAGEIIGCPYMEDSSERTIEDYSFFTVHGDTVEPKALQKKLVIGI